MRKAIRKLKDRFHHSKDSQSSKPTSLSNTRTFFEVEELEGFKIVDSPSGAKKATRSKASRSVSHGLFVLHPPPELPYEKESLLVE